MLLTRDIMLSAVKQAPVSIDFNEEFRRALDLMENSSKSVFVTGRAGTGKSTLLTHFRRTTEKKVVVLAPTGVAALNVGGQTIHSFFRFRPTITMEGVKKVRSESERDIYRNLDTIVIDEISMVRADLLDCVDKFLRLNGPKARKPFGGVQMIFIGDLYQLPPVVARAEREVFESLYDTPYFYGARVFQAFEMELVELEKVYRQHDEQFIGLLNAIRNRSIGDEGLEILNRRYLPEREPPSQDFYLHLTTTNDLAEQVNSKKLAELKSPARVFKGSIDGEFGREYLPTAVDLKVKAGAQVMMLNNDSAGRWVNGTIGEIARISAKRNGDCVIEVDLADGKSTVEVTPFTWEISSFFAEGGKLQSEVVGKFTQYPLMLAWAVTIHKAQGKTFDRVIIDFGRGTFVHGQAYVALSRCTSLDGIVLTRPLLKKDILMDFKVVKFLTKYQYDKAAESCSLDDKVRIIEQAIKDKAGLRIVYLKPNDEKSRRVIVPAVMGEMEYQGKTYLGVRGLCMTRKQDRTFRVDRILEIEEQAIGSGVAADNDS